ncbi:MAG: S-layer homology domain-containing protein [Clostridia bacterium]|nr:S-layer homology domain-containing protein [Clostridia bacterium]
MKSIKRLMATVLMLVMVFTMAMGTFVVSVSAAVTCTKALIVVDDDFAGTAKGTTVNATVAGTKYTGKMGSTAFATLQDAVKAVDALGSVYVAAGVYFGHVELGKGVHFYGNRMDISPNNATNASIASDKRAATGVDESILQNMQISYSRNGASESMTNNYFFTLNGFAMTGDSCVNLRGARYNNTRINFVNNVLDIVNENAFDIIGVSSEEFTAVQFGLENDNLYIAAEVNISNNRVHRVSSAGSGLSVCHGLAAYWAGEFTVSDNYITQVSDNMLVIGQLRDVTTVTDNYFYNGGQCKIYNNIGGLMEISGNTFDAVGGQTALSSYALGIYANGNESYACQWLTSANNVNVHDNTFINLGNAIHIAPVIREDAMAANGNAYGLKIYDNNFVPYSKDNCNFIELKSSANVHAPEVYDNYTGGLNPKTISRIVNSDIGASIDFGSYWLNEAKTDSSDSLAVKDISNTAGVSMAADISVAPDCTITGTIPYSISEITLSLTVADGASYEMFVDQYCTTPLVNNTLPLKEGLNYAYAKVNYGIYSAVYTIMLTKKMAYANYLPADELVVDQDFAQYAAGQIIYVQIGDGWYRAQIGYTAFGDLATAISNAQSGDTIHLTAGLYTGSMTFRKGVILRGAKAGINPTDMNSATFERSPERGNEAEETVFDTKMTLASGINGLTWDGIMFIEGASFVYSGSFNVNGLTFKNMLLTGTGEDTLLYNSRNDNGAKTHSNFLMQYCRLEYGSSRYIMRIPNISSAKFDGNVFYEHSKQIYVGGTDGSPADVFEVTNNIFYGCTNGNLFYIGQTTGSDGSNSGSHVLNSMHFENNRFIDCAGSNIISVNRWRTGGKFTFVNNSIEGTTKGRISITPEPDYGAQVININNNFYGASATTVLNNNTDVVADVSRNYFTNGTAEAIAGLGKYVPYYIDAEMTILKGDYKVDSVKAPIGAVIDEATKTISYTGTTSADSLKIDLTVSEGASYELYKNETCTEKIAGTTLPLTGKNTVAYVKVIAEDGVTNAVYTLNITQPESSAADLLGLDIEGSTYVAQTGNCLIPAAYTKGTIIPLVSAGAEVSVYNINDTEMTTPINYNMEMDIATGKTSYLVKVVSESGTNTKVYTLNLIRQKADVTEIKAIVGDFEEAVIDNTANTVTAVYGNETEKLLPVLEVASNGTYKLYKDIGAENLPINAALALEIGENVMYAKVTAEDGVATKIYKLIIIRNDKSNEKYVLSAAFPEYATTQEQLDEDDDGRYKGVKRIDNAHQTIYLQPMEYIESLEDTLAVSENATYEIYKDYDLVNNRPVSAAISSSTGAKVLNLKEGNNVFYIRITAANGTKSIYTMTVANIIRSTENELLSVNGFSMNRQGNVINVRTATDAPQVDIFVSDYATVKVFADRKKTIEVPSSMMTYVVTATQEAFNDCRLNTNPAQSYLKLYVDVTSQSGDVAEYVLKITSGSFSATFSDIEKHWAKDYISAAYTMGITTGTSNVGGVMTFSPQENANRQQIAVFICNLLGISTDAYSAGKLNYKDKNKISSWAKGAVAATNALGIMQGDENGNFNPKANITRQEFMIVMVRACNLDTSKGTNKHIAKFKDASAIATWAKVYVKTAVAYGLVNGDENGYVNPTKPINRAEIVKIIVSAKDYAR